MQALDLNQRLAALEPSPGYAYWVSTHQVGRMQKELLPTFYPSASPFGLELTAEGLRTFG